MHTVKKKLIHIFHGENQNNGCFYFNGTPTIDDIGIIKVRIESDKG